MWIYHISFFIYQLIFGDFPLCGHYEKCCMNIHVSASVWTCFPFSRVYVMCNSVVNPFCFPVPVIFPLPTSFSSRVDSLGDGIRDNYSALVPETCLRDTLGLFRSQSRETFLVPFPTFVVLVHPSDFSSPGPNRNAGDLLSAEQCVVLILRWESVRTKACGWTMFLPSRVLGLKAGGDLIALSSRYSLREPCLLSYSSDW